MTKPRRALEPRRAAVDVAPRRELVPTPWYAEPDARDRLIKVMYESKAQAPEPYTDERWARMKEMFKPSIRVLERELDEMIENGEFDE